MGATSSGLSQSRSKTRRLVQDRRTRRLAPDSAARKWGTGGVRRKRPPRREEAPRRPQGMGSIPALAAWPTKTRSTRVIERALRLGLNAAPRREAPHPDLSTGAGRLNVGNFTVLRSRATGTTFSSCDLVDRVGPHCPGTRTAKLRRPRRITPALGSLFLAYCHFRFGSAIASVG
jgi:hypothetical protein